MRDLESLVAKDLERDIPSAPKPARKPRLTMLSEVQSAPMQLLDEELGKALSTLCITAGRGGSGKSTLLLKRAALLTRGELAGVLYGQPTPILLISHEDPLAQVVKPRFIAAGGRPDMLVHLAVEAEEETTTGLRVPKLPLDADLIRDAIRQTGARYIIIDPVSSTLDGDTDKLHDVRAALDPLAVIAEELTVLIDCIAHFRKGSNGATADLVSGSHGFRDAARTLLLVAEDRETGERIISVEKGNYGSGGGSWRFRLEPVAVVTDDGGQTTVTRVTDFGTSTTSVADVIAAEAGPRYGRGRSELLDFVRTSPMPVTLTEILVEFPDEKPATVRSWLTRLVQSHDLARTDLGHYAPAAAASRTAASATSAADRLAVALVADVAPPHARESNCTVCGMPMHPAALAGGFDTHPGCEASR